VKHVDTFAEANSQWFSI